MILDRTGLFSENQAITASTASTNVVDLGRTGTPYGATAPLTRDVGRGTETPFYAGVVQSFNNLTSLELQIQVSADAAFTTPVVVFRSPAYTLAQLQAGAAHLLPDSLPVGTNLRYLRVYYTVTGTNPTLGQITAGTTMARQTNRGIY
jgi:hypothetical protein